MPPTQRGQAYRLGPNRWGLRYYAAAGKRRRKSPFPSRSAALAHYRDVIEPELRGEAPAAPELTLAAFCELYLERHVGSVRPRTIATLRERLSHALAAFGDLPLSDLERMTGELAGWRARQPEGVRYGRMGALSQTLEAAVRWGYIGSNPAKQAGPNRQPPPRSIRAFTLTELDAITAELSAIYRPLPAFAAATGLRPEEWAALERRDIARVECVVSIRRTVSSGKVVELGKTMRSRRQVPLSCRALDALDGLPARLDSPLLFPAVRGGVLNLDNWRRREWLPAIEASGVRRPARIYDLRSTFASRALAAGVSVFELARIMGTSGEMIERAYGTMIEGAGAGIASRLDAFDARGDAEDEHPGAVRATNAD
jgi:integrase